jgi:hypothetical protein
MTSSGARSPQATRSPRNPRQASVDSARWRYPARAGPACRRRWSPRRTAPAQPERRRGRGSGSVHEHLQRVQADQRAGPPGGELALNGFADPTDRPTRPGRLRCRAPRPGWPPRPGRQPAHGAGDDQRLQRMGAGHALAQQPPGEGGIGAAQFGPLQGDRPAGGLDGHGLVAVAVAGPGVWVTLVAVAAQEPVLLVRARAWVSLLELALDQHLRLSSLSTEPQTRPGGPPETACAMLISAAQRRPPQASSPPSTQP